MSSDPSHDLFAYYGTSGSSERDGIIGQALQSEPLSLEAPRLLSPLAKAGFLKLNGAGDLLFVTELGEGGAGLVHSFRREAGSGELSRLSTGQAGGGGLCHLNLDRSERWLLAASYGDACVSVFPISAEGRIGALAQSFRLEGPGSGVNAARQEGPHAHSIYAAPSNRFVFVCDLGMDRICVYAFDADSGRLEAAPTPFVATAPGAGPRHLAFHANGQWVYGINELDGSISHYLWNADTGSLEAQGALATLPDGFSGENTTAEILVHPNGRFLYGSNRGHDSLVAYAIDAESGALSLVQRIASGGAHPRNFVLNSGGGLLAVANRDSNNVVYFSVEAETGLLEPLETVEDITACTCVRLVGP